MRASREIVPARIAERFSVPITLMREVATATGGAAWTSASRVEADRCWTWWWEGMVRYGKSRRVCVCVCVCESSRGTHDGSKNVRRCLRVFPILAEGFLLERFAPAVRSLPLVQRRLSSRRHLPRQSQSGRGLQRRAPELGQS
jgi:hypothetical protein